MELLNIDSVNAQVAQAPLRAFPDVIARKCLVCRNTGGGGQQSILWWHFGGNINPLVSAAHNLADQLLTVPVPVGKSSIDKAQTQIDSPMKGCQRFLILSADPTRFADSPGTITNP